jgi:4-hydroxy-3-methylbut-2-en-1-yl diphosphate synthase IspG/GcpE
MYENTSNAGWETGYWRGQSRNDDVENTPVKRFVERLYALTKPLTIAVMGCEVNGIREAKNTDIGITGAGDHAVIFQKGKMIEGK